MRIDGELLQLLSINQGFPYLGVILQLNMSWSEQVKKRLVQ